MNAPYPTSQEIFGRAENISEAETWSDLYKKDLLEAGLMVACCLLCLMGGSPYLEALLRRGLKRRENKETTTLSWRRR